MLITITSLVLATLPHVLALPQSRAAQTCDSDICVETSRRIRSWMNQTVDPCDDFYAFTCGRWTEKHPVPAGSFKDISTELELKAYDVLVNIFESEYIPDSELTSSKSEMDKELFEKAKNFYSSCTESLDKPVDVLNAFEKVFGTAAKETEGDPNAEWVTDLVATAHSFGMNVLFEPKIIRNPDNIKQNMLVLAATDTRADFQTWTSWKRPLGVRIPVLPEGDFKDYSRAWMVHSKTNITMLNIGLPQLNWESYFQKLFPDNQFSFKVLPELSIPIEGSQDLLGNLSTLANMSRLEFLEYMLAAFEYHINDIPFIIWYQRRSIFGQDMSMNSPDTIQRRCAVATADVFSGPSDRWFVRQTMPKSVQESIADYVDRIKEVFFKSIPEIKWLDKATANAAVEKVKAMAVDIGAFEESMSVQQGYDLYQSLNICATDFVGNSVAGLKSLTSQLLKQLDMPLSEFAWPDSNYFANAAYKDEPNALYIFAAIALGSNFNTEFPAYLNYGALGTTIGHEVTHGFDSRGRLYDLNGDKKDWWSDGSDAAFNKQRKCLIDLSREDKLGGTEELRYRPSASSSIDETIADHGGLHMAWNAWQDHSADDKKVNFNLPHLQKYTEEQLFFISFGQSWCRSPVHKEDFDLEGSQSHPPNEARVRSAVMHSQEFAKAFQCPTGSKMNPEKKCPIW